VKQILSLFFIVLITTGVFSQGQLHVTDKKSGLRLSVINTTYPLLKLLLSGEADTERGIEIEFPEHVTGMNAQSKKVQQLYFVSLGTRNKRTLPVWKVIGNSIRYETTLQGNIRLIATATLDSLGVRYQYFFRNESDISYLNLQAVTCVKLYSTFADTLLQRVYVHTTKGFELLASDMPERLKMPLTKWLPCRYLVSHTWPVPVQRVQKDEDGIPRYYKSTKADRPFLATLSHDKKWVAATYTATTGNMWTNPERSCQHADPSTKLPARGEGILNLRTFVYKDSLERLLKYVDQQ